MIQCSIKMSENNNVMIRCGYGDHLVNKEDFTQSGINKKYFTQCRKCKAEEMKKYRQKHKEKYNNSVRDYKRLWIANKRAAKKSKEIEVEN